jgi:hypothetical protein
VAMEAVTVGAVSAAAAILAAAAREETGKRQMQSLKCRAQIMRIFCPLCFKI